MTWRRDQLFGNAGPFLAICGKSKPHEASMPLMQTVLLLLACLTPSLAKAASTDDEIRAFVEKVNVASTSFFVSGSEADARQKCRDLLAWAFDVPAMGKEVLGKAWDRATDEERKKYIEAFEDEVISAYLRRMRPPGTTLTFIGHRPPVGGDQLAASRRSVPGKADQTWIWWMRPDGQSWRIVDLLLDGHSVLNAETQEYANVLASNNGDINALIAFMHKRAGT
jgi:phospholipid transport system substrate-binding protein